MLGALSSDSSMAATSHRGSTLLVFATVVWDSVGA
jgi:hypothetical protein